MKAPLDEHSFRKTLFDQELPTTAHVEGRNRQCCMRERERADLRLMGNAAMGAATGLCFALLLVAINPGVGILLEHGGSSAMRVFVGTLVATFAIGASLTGAVLILTEDNES